MKNKTLMAVLLAVVSFTIVFALVALSGLMSEVKNAMPQPDIGNTGGGTTENDVVGGNTGGEGSGSESEDPTISYANADFVLMEPEFVYKNDKAGIGFRACVSFDFRTTAEAAGGVFYMIMCPIDIVNELIDASGDALVIDWVTVMQERQEAAAEGETIFLKQQITDEEFLRGTEYWIARDELVSIKYATHNRVIVGIPFVQYRNGSRQYASLPNPDESYKSMACSYAYLCSEAYTKMVCDGVSWVSGAQAAFKDALMKSANLANGNAAENIDTALTFTLSLDQNSVKLNVENGDAVELTPKIAPSVALYYTWKSSDTAVAIVENGLVIPIAPGNAVITLHMGEIVAKAAICVVDASTKTTTCTNCKHEYVSSTNTCPLCGCYWKTKTAYCGHCAEKIQYQLFCDITGTWVGEDFAVECEYCDCTYKVTGTDAILHCTYDCAVYIAVVTETKQATCTCCTATLTWEIDINCYGDWIYYEGVAVTCIGCECEYWVTEDGSQLSIGNDCRGSGWKTFTRTRTGTCEHCAELIMWEIECYPNGTWDGADVTAYCLGADCECDYRVTGNGGTLEIRYQCAKRCPICNSFSLSTSETGTHTCTACGAYSSLKRFECDHSSCREWITYHVWYDYFGNELTEDFIVECPSCGCEYKYLRAQGAVKRTYDCSNPDD